MCTSFGKNAGTKVGIPIPKFTYIPSLTSFVALFTIFSLTSYAFLYFSLKIYKFNKLIFNENF